MHCLPVIRLSDSGRLQGVLPTAHIGSFNIQRYEPGGHFLKVHSDDPAAPTGAGMDDLSE